MKHIYILFVWQQFDNIEHNISDAAEYVAKTEVILKDAEKYQKKARNRRYASPMSAACLVLICAYSFSSFLLGFPICFDLIANSLPLYF